MKVVSFVISFLEEIISFQRQLTPELVWKILCIGCKLKDYFDMYVFCFQTLFSGIEGAFDKPGSKTVIPKKVSDYSWYFLIDSFGTVAVF